MGDNGHMTPTSPLRARPRSLRALLGTACLVLALWASPAGAHGDLQSTIPEKGSKLEKVPDHLIINFTEAPTKQSLVSVKDGCKDEVVDELQFDGNVAHVFLSKGQPGKWKVSYKVVSAIDGHRTNGSYSLDVTGQADCSANNGGSDPDDKGAGPGPNAADPDNGEDGDESSFPVVPVVIGSLGLVALALVARRLSG